MPNINDFLSDVFHGATHPKGNLGDFQHASRLYLDNNYALTPKAGWIYYVFFSINPSAETMLRASSQTDLEAGMLVKSVDLPKFQIQTEQLNQYNRRTVVQTKINYQPISLSFHDDMSNVTNQLWWNYFRYYYADTAYGSSAGGLDRSGIFGGSSGIPGKTAAFSNTKYGANPPVPANGYGLNNNQAEPFFNSIIVYQMNQKLFTSYIIVNPIITSWEHDKMDQSNGNHLTENKMTVQYETVFYGTGQVSVGNPPGFATFHYDSAPSPLSIQGGGTGTLFGPGGVIPGALQIFGDVGNVLNGSGSPLGLLGAGLGLANLVNNAGKLNSRGLAAEGYSILGGLLGSAAGRGSIPAGVGAGLGGGAVGAALSLFKGGNSSTNNQTQAGQKNITGGGGGAIDTLGGATTALAGGGGNAPVGVPLGPADIPTDSAGIGNLISQNENDITAVQSAIEKNQSLQASYDNAIQSAQQNGGADAVAQVNAAFAQAGYQDPSKLQASLDTLQANNSLLYENYNAALNLEKTNPSLASDSDQSGPQDPNAQVNTANNQDSNVSDQVVVSDAGNTDSSNDWSA